MTNQEKADYHKVKANVFNKLYEAYKELRDMTSAEEKIFWTEQANEMYDLFLANSIEGNKYLAIVNSAAQHDEVVDNMKKIFY